MSVRPFFHASALLAAASLAAVYARTAEGLLLESPALRLRWESTAEGWRAAEVAARAGDRLLPLGTPSGAYTILFAAAEPSAAPVPLPWSGHPEGFPEPNYRYLIPTWREVTTAVALNTAGEAHTFLPATAERRTDGAVVFTGETDAARLRAEWQLDPAHPGDVRVTLSLVAKRAGWFSLASPTLATLAPADLAWAMVPGYFQGREFQPDFVRAYAYGHGLPERPVLVRERAASTLAPLMTRRDGGTLAAVPEPGTAADPWEKDQSTRSVWRLGLSHLNRAGQLSPTLYHPVLGQTGSHLAAGDAVTFRLRYVLRPGDWFSVLDHVARRIYRVGDLLDLQQPRRSLSDRLHAMHRYVTDPVTSLWQTETYQGVTIGAQAYRGGVLNAQGDAMKNSDHGAMWMLAQLSGDPALVRDRLPFARNFKLQQQERTPGFFAGSAAGQYYLAKSRRFTEEWGDYVEPVALTYYVLIDLGNILLFAPGDAELRERFRLGAERLRQWQHPDGHWEIAYDRATQRPLFRDLPDLRPTFYGLLVAHRVLGDPAYLAAARRGADWLIAHAVAPGHFTGVCGDTRFTPDFATAQIAQALLDLHEATGEVRYREAGLAAARFYVASVYTHPIASRRAKVAGGQPREDWEINQTGLVFEHGGTIGSANRGGPILLVSHAGLFVRCFALTGERIFLDLARAGALARDAFVDPATSVASYYWQTMNRGPGPFPHHAWWQIGWIVDYLIAEATLRAGGRIAFPRGFFTPKVGPHASYGFAPGAIFGEPAALAWAPVATGRPEIDTLIARSPDGRRGFVILLNQSPRPQTARVAPDFAAFAPDRNSAWSAARRIDADGRRHAAPAEAAPWEIPLGPYGLEVLVLE